MSMKTTTIGAYPKPGCTPIGDWFPDADDEAAREQGRGLLQRWSITEYEQRLTASGVQAEVLFLQATREVIEDQIEAGVDIPTDGEVRRENYIYYQCRRIAGLDFDTVTRKEVRGGAFAADLPTITGPVSLRSPRLHRDFELAQGFSKNPVKITVPGPMTITDSVADAHYGDDARLGADLGDALNQEILRLAEAGCRYIQVDEPVFARKPAQALAYGIDNLERCFSGLPDGVMRLIHMCCGYPNALDVEGYLKADLDAYRQIAGAVNESSVDAVSIEDAHRQNDLKLLELYSHTTVLLGVIDVAKSRVENVEEIRSRLLQACEHIDHDRLVAAPDCGLGLLGRRLALKKLNNMCAAAHSL